MHGAKCFELLDDVTYELWELVDRLAELDQGVGAFLVDAVQPGADRVGRDQLKR